MLSKVGLLDCVCIVYGEVYIEVKKGYSIMHL